MWIPRNKAKSSASKGKTGASSHRAAGERRELDAEEWLIQRGFVPITRNYRTRGGEIDLIMRDADTLVFVEVRYRKTTEHGTGAETITYHKQQRLRRAALHYLQKHFANREPPCRFDVMSGTGDPVVFEWISNAF
jgi:putative endonuclease